MRGYQRLARGPAAPVPPPRGAVGHGGPEGPAGAEVSLDAGRLLVDAIPAAPTAADYYSQVAPHLIESDTVLFRGRYRDALKSALVRRGILSLRAASTVTRPGAATRARRTRGPAAAGADQTRRLSLSADDFGLEGRVLIVEAPGEARRFEVTA